MRISLFFTTLISILGGNKEGSK